MLVRSKRWLDRLLAPKADGTHDLMRTFTAPGEETPNDVRLPAPAPVANILYRLQSLKDKAEILDQWLPFGANMGEVIQFVPSYERERARLIREARAAYESIFPSADPVSKQPGKATVTHTANGADTHRGEVDLLS
jgi:hypothetical protein